MPMTAQKGAAVALTAVLAIALSACGRDDAAEGVAGVTDEPCPNAVDKEKGCIYLGVITDLTGPFKGIGVPLTEGQKAFWGKVNSEGGIGDYEVDVTTHVKDNKYDPDIHAQAYGQIDDEVLALAQSIGTAHTNGILKDLQRSDVLVQPASLGSNWIFEKGVIEVGTNYCAEAMNAVDYAKDKLDARSVLAVHYPGDYGDDAMVGARIAASERGLDFTEVTTEPGADKQQAAVSEILKSDPDLVVVSTGPIEMASIIGAAVQQGYDGQFIGSMPTWNAAVLDTPAATAIQDHYLQASSFGTWESDTAGHEAMRKASAEVTPNDWYMMGWAGSYIMKAALEKAIDGGTLTRESLVEAAQALGGVDGDGMLLPGSGNYKDDPNSRVVTSVGLNRVDPAASSKVTVAETAFEGPTARDYDFTEPCYLQK